MSTTFTAQVAQIFPIESFTTKDGRPFSKRRILLQTVEQYPQRMVITVSNDLATGFAKQIGDTITAHISFDVSSNHEQTYYFNEIRCWRVD